MFSTEKTKRKNEAPRSSRRIVFALTALLVVIAGAGLFLTALVVPSDAAGQIFYGYTIDPTTDVFYHVNLNTGKSDMYAWYPPHATTVGYEAPPPKRQITHELGWDSVRSGEEYDLVIRDAGTDEEWRALGRFYTNYYHFTDASWSPDGQWAVFSAFNENVASMEIYNYPQDLWMVNAETGDLRRLTDDDNDDRNPTFTLDGKSILYVSDRDGTRRLYAMDLASGESRLLVPDLLDIYGGYAWSPDEQWLAFTSLDAETQVPTSNLPSGEKALSSLYIYNPGTEALRKVTSERISDYIWSPDSQWLAFSTLDPMSTDSQRVSESAIWAAGASIDPYYEPHPSSIWIVRTNGADKQQIGSTSFGLRTLEWIP